MISGETLRPSCVINFPGFADIAKRHAKGKSITFGQKVYILARFIHGETGYMRATLVTTQRAKSG
jgi:hypothetical protein